LLSDQKREEVESSRKGRVKIRRVFGIGRKNSQKGARGHRRSKETSPKVLFGRV